jgi:hypothetical protein
MRNLAFCFWLICALLGSGCKDGGSGAGIPASGLATEYAATFCHKLFTCCDAAELASNSVTMVDEATCRSMVAPPIDADVASDQTSVNAGRATYHGDRARTCMDKLIALPCEQWGADNELRRIPECFHVYEGTVAPGGTCNRSVECIDGHCDLVAGCVADGKAGEACDIGSCAGELVCITAGATSFTCGSVQADGAPCDYSDECASNNCGLNTSGARVCIPPTICNGV